MIPMTLIENKTRTEKRLLQKMTNIGLTAHSTGFQGGYSSLSETVGKSTKWFKREAVSSGRVVERTGLGVRRGAGGFQLSKAAPRHDFISTQH